MVRLCDGVRPWSWVWPGCGLEWSKAAVECEQAVEWSVVRLWNGLRLWSEFWSGVRL